MLGRCGSLDRGFFDWQSIDSTVHHPAGGRSTERPYVRRLAAHFQRRGLLIIVVGHGEGGAAQAEGFDGFGGYSQALGELRLLFGRELAKHEVNLSAAGEIVTHAEAEPRIAVVAELAMFFNPL